MDTESTDLVKEDSYVVENNEIDYKIVKRLMDIVLSFFGLIILSPVFLIVAIAIKLDGPKGEVFFNQIRIGTNGKEFKIYKFRSMYPDAEDRLRELKHLNEIHGHMFKMKEDPRITKIGKFIRAYSIDELPQLLNVLKGDMSLIGPRPCLLSEYESYTEFDKSRLVIRPGITGLWQVSGRNSLSFNQMVLLDLKYIKNLSFKNDVKIFYKTIFVVLKKENAY